MLFQGAHPGQSDPSSMAPPLPFPTSDLQPPTSDLRDWLLL